ncbi:MAG TPA: sugar phosphate nucleotidyltransferase, partial [Gammaproteobacteria bacterium]|nr:sugar phosphate nucleotidyltransferase [Gammaproteobacteria bacterium]
CGIVETNASGLVVAFHEKVAEPPGIRANAAVYIVEPSVLVFLASLKKTVIDFSTEVLPHYLGRMQVFHNSDYHRDIGNLESLRLAELEFIN